MFQRVEELSLYVLDTRNKSAPEQQARALFDLGLLSYLRGLASKRKSLNHPKWREQALIAQRYMLQAIRGTVVSKADDLSGMWSGLGRVHELLDEYDEAISCFERAVVYAMAQGDDERVAGINEHIANNLVHKGQNQGALLFTQNALSELQDHKPRSKRSVRKFLTNILLLDANRLSREAHHLSGDGEPTYNKKLEDYDAAAVHERFEKAIEQCDRIIATGQKHTRPDVFYLKASLLFQRATIEFGIHDEKVKAFCKEGLAALSQASPTTRIGRTWVHSMRGYLESTYAKTCEYVGDLDEALAAHERAIRALRQARKSPVMLRGHHRLVFSRQCQCYLDIGTIHQTNHRYPSALKSFRRAALLAKEYFDIFNEKMVYNMYFDAMFALGKCQHLQGNIGFALRTFRRLAAFCEKSPAKLSHGNAKLIDALAHLGYQQTLTKDWVGTRQTYELLITRAGKSRSSKHKMLPFYLGDAHFNLTLVPGMSEEEQSKHLYKAVAAFDRAIRTKGNDIDAITKKVRATITIAASIRSKQPNRARKMYGRALTSLDQALERTPGNYNLIDAKMDTLVKFALFEGVSGRFSAAIPKLKSAVDLYKPLIRTRRREADFTHRMANTFLLLGEAYLFTKQQGLGAKWLIRAFKYIQKARILKPRNPEFLKTFNEIQKYFQPAADELSSN